ncbi:MAG: substrate-binding domain-containing protein [Deltaproteobacteria bacterium]|nr:substrate-binding domain-containing protein [Deltaproteobacteria bacterium]
MPRRPALFPALLALALALALATACHGQEELVVFHSEGLSPLLGELAQRLGRQTPALRIRLEPSPSALAVRKVTELGLAADVVALADSGLAGPLRDARRMAAWHPLATDEVVLAHKDHSRHTDEVGTRNWTEVIDRPGVRLGCASPETSEAGLHAQMTWQLAGQQGLRLRCQRDNTVPGEAELIALLEARAVDYAFVHRSTASVHHLKVTALPREWNLSSLELADAYRTASVGDGASAHVGRPIEVGLAFLRGAKNPKGAQRLLDALRSELGRRALERAGFHPLGPSAWMAGEP